MPHMPTGPQSGSPQLTHPILIKYPPITSKLCNYCQWHLNIFTWHVNPPPPPITSVIWYNDGLILIVLCGLFHLAMLGIIWARIISPQADSISDGQWNEKLSRAIAVNTLSWSRHTAGLWSDIWTKLWVLDALFNFGCEDQYDVYSQVHVRSCFVSLLWNALS